MANRDSTWRLASEIKHVFQVLGMRQHEYYCYVYIKTFKNLHVVGILIAHQWVEFSSDSYS